MNTHMPVIRIPTHTLTVYLLKEGLAANAVISNRAGLTSTTLDLNGLECELLTKRSRPSPPKWLRLFEARIKGDDLELWNQSTSGVLLVPVAGRLVALTFGHGRYLLVPSSFEERFGLKVTLNSIRHDSIRSIDKRTFDAMTRHVREQTPKSAKALDFGLDIENDLLRAVTGSPKDEDLGKRMSGMDALVVSVKTTLDSLPALLERYVEQAGSDEYKTDYPWVDNIAELKDKDVIKELEAELLAKLQSSDLDRLWLAVPEIIDWARVGSFRFKKSKAAPSNVDLHLEDFLEGVDDPSSLDLESLKKAQAYCFSVDDDQEMEKWSLWQCLSYETEVRGDVFILSGGKWYRIEQSFAKKVQDFYDALPDCALPLPPYDHANEAEYIRAVAKDDSAFEVFDGPSMLIRRSGEKDGIEFCDLFHESKRIIHVKRYGGSKVLSHLFAQGLVSGEALQQDAEFRKNLNPELPPSSKLSDPEAPLNTQDYEIVYAIVSFASGPLTVPFFSRVNLRHVARRLQSYRYKVSKAMIVDEKARRAKPAKRAARKSASS